MRGSKPSSLRIMVGLAEGIRFRRTVWPSDRRVAADVEGVREESLGRGRMRALSREAPGERWGREGSVWVVARRREWQMQW